MSEAAPERRFRKVRSFVVRGGRLTDGQQRAMDELWPRFGVPFKPELVDLNALFGRSAQCILEIGFGDGENLAALAERNREMDFIGVEVHPPGVGHLLLQVSKHELSNLRIFNHDAIDVLQQQIAVASLDRVLVLFPDPWHKKRHNKRRLVNSEFATLVASRLKHGGVLQLATDWAPYAEQMLYVLNQSADFRNLSADQTYMEGELKRTPTRFERRGVRLGHEVYDLWFERR
jgi:tRNA (guanine-N7-)-methyltransferase